LILETSLREEVVLFHLMEESRHFDLGELPRHAHNPGEGSLHTLRDMVDHDEIHMRDFESVDVHIILCVEPGVVPGAILQQDWSIAWILY